MNIAPPNAARRRGEGERHIAARRRQWADLCPIFWKWSVIRPDHLQRAAVAALASWVLGAVGVVVVMASRYHPGIGDRAAVVLVYGVVLAVCAGAAGVCTLP